MDVLTKAQLSDLKRPELQKLCKEHGLKGGNSKKDVLVELILAHYKSQDHTELHQFIGEDAAQAQEDAVEVDVRVEEPEKHSRFAASASRNRLASSRPAPRAPTSRKATSAASTSKLTAGGAARAAANKPTKDIVVFDEESDDGNDAGLAEDEDEEQADGLAPLEAPHFQPMHSTNPSPLLLKESGPSSSSSRAPPPPPPQPTASPSTLTTVTTAQVQSLISTLPTQAHYNLLSTQMAFLSSSYTALANLPTQVGALPTRAELEVLRREMLEGGWVRKEQVEAIVEGRMAKVERRLAALEVGARSVAAFDPLASTTAHHQRVSSTSSLGKHPRSPSVTFAPHPLPSAFGARQTSGGPGSGTPASSSAYGTLGLGFGLPSGEAGPSSYKKARGFSGQSDMDLGTVDSMLDDKAAEEQEDPDKTLDDQASPPFVPCSRSGTPRTPSADPLLTPPHQQSPTLPDHSLTPAPGRARSRTASIPPSSSHHLHQHHHPFDAVAEGSGHPESPHTHSPQKDNLPIATLPFPFFATSPRPPTRAPPSPTLSVGWDSPRKTSGGAASGPAQMSMSSASSTGGLTPGRALFTSATGPGGETPKAFGGRGTPGRRLPSSAGGAAMFGGVPGSGATLQGLVNARPSEGGGGGGLFGAHLDASTSSSASSSSQSVFGAPLPLPPSVTSAGSSSKPSSSNSMNSPFLAPASLSSTSLLPPLPLNAPLSLSPGYNPPFTSTGGGSNALPFPFPISPHPSAANNPRARAIQRGDLTGRMPPPPTPPAQKTLFGTEREVDGRFGDDDE